MFKKNLLKLSALLLVLIFVFTSIGAVYADNTSPANPESNTPTNTDNQSSTPNDPGLSTPAKESYEQCVTNIYDKGIEDCNNKYSNTSEATKDEDGKKLQTCYKEVDAKTNKECYDKYLAAQKEANELIINKQFKVSEYLRISNDTQTYLDDTENKGIVYFIVRSIEILTRIIGSFALLVMIAGGITILISSGNQNLQQAGKRMILYSVVGLVIAFLSVFIVSFVQSIFYTT